MDDRSWNYHGKLANSLLATLQSHQPSDNTVYSAAHSNITLKKGLVAKQQTIGAHLIISSAVSGWK